MNKCVDCCKEICKQAMRCNSCSNKNRKGKYKISKAALERRKGKYKWSKFRREELKSENNPNWKGDSVKKEGLHEWVRRRKPKPRLCSQCRKTPPYDLANISGKYKRDVNDYEWICRSCHMKKDGRINNLKQFGGN